MVYLAIRIISLSQHDPKPFPCLTCEPVTIPANFIGVTRVPKFTANESVYTYMHSTATGHIGKKVRKSFEFYRVPCFSYFWGLYKECKQKRISM